MSKEDKKTNTKKPAGETESKFFLHELREHSQELFDVKPEILDGVFYNTKEIQFSKSEVKRRIDAFLKKKVNTKKEAKK